MIRFGFRISWFALTGFASAAPGNGQIWRA